MFSKLANAIDSFNRKQGDITSLLIIPLIGVIVYEVIMRYGFNAPTVWGFEVTAFIYGMHYMFGIAYTDVRKGHVQVDIFTSLAPKKIQALLGAITTIVLFMPVMTCMTWAATKFAWTSVSLVEHNSTSWAPAIYPYKIIMALCFFFVLLQGVANLIHDLQTLFGKER
jgi:TRAP-type mannitol/chloroaromatic compound transport system permease small subunit